MEYEASRTDRQHELANIEAAFELLIERKPHKILEIRQHICQAWQNGFLTDHACKRLYQKISQIQTS